uniref:glycogenin glucosyltransferase n=1 Tax=Trichobilharzia regenti TaxID=157069 RepID=A0AA85K4H2_TRIRE|nr:unnamed protein product [Trichobilharzia regenti]
MIRETFITLATNDEYCVGALVLGASLRQTETKKELTILVTSTLTSKMRSLLSLYYDNVIEVQPVAPEDWNNPFLGNRKELTATFTKICAWSLVEFDKAVFMDADTLVLDNIDELFDRPELSAAPDTLWPDCFNAGVFVLKPSMDIYNGLLQMLSTTGSFDGREQGLLNTYFSNWLQGGISHRLPCTYNCICRISESTQFEFYTSRSAWVQFGGTIRVAHFSGPIKPWHKTSAAKTCSQAAFRTFLNTNTNRRSISRVAGMLAYWWSLFLILIRPHFSPDMYLGYISLDTLRKYEQCQGSINNNINNNHNPVNYNPHSSQPSESSKSNNYSDGNHSYTPYYPTFHEQYKRHDSSTILTQQQQQQQPSSPPPEFLQLPYHPEFHDTTWDYLHRKQRIDEDNRFVEHHNHQTSIVQEPQSVLQPQLNLSLSGIRYDQEKTTSTSEPHQHHHHHHQHQEPQQHEVHHDTAQIKTSEDQHQERSHHDHHHHHHDHRHHHEENQSIERSHQHFEHQNIEHQHIHRNEENNPQHNDCHISIDDNYQPSTDKSTTEVKPEDKESPPTNASSSSSTDEKPSILIHPLLAESLNKTPSLKLETHYSLNCYKCHEEMIRQQQRHQQYQHHQSRSQHTTSNPLKTRKYTSEKDLSLKQITKKINRRHSCYGLFVKPSIARKIISPMQRMKTSSTHDDIQQKAVNEIDDNKLITTSVGQKQTRASTEKDKFMKLSTSENVLNHNADKTSSHAKQESSKLFDNMSDIPMSSHLHSLDLASPSPKLLTPSIIDHQPDVKVINGSNLYEMPTEKENEKVNSISIHKIDRMLYKRSISNEESRQRLNSTSLNSHQLENNNRLHRSKVKCMSLGEMMMNTSSSGRTSLSSISLQPLSTSQSIGSCHQGEKMTSQNDFKKMTIKLRSKSLKRRSSDKITNRRGRRRQQDLSSSSEKETSFYIHKKNPFSIITSHYLSSRQTIYRRHTIGIGGELANVDFGKDLCLRHAQIEAVSIERMYAWERGEIDYTGSDRFINILNKLCTTLQYVGGEANLPIGIDVIK